MHIIGRPHHRVQDPTLAMDDTRNIHMTSLKERVRSREYEVDPGAVAEALLRHLAELPRRAQARDPAPRPGRRAALTSH